MKVTEIKTTTTGAAISIDAASEREVLEELYHTCLRAVDVYAGENYVRFGLRSPLFEDVVSFVLIRPGARELAISKMTEEGALRVDEDDAGFQQSMDTMLGDTDGALLAEIAGTLLMLLHESENFQQISLEVKPAGEFTAVTILAFTGDVPLSDDGESVQDV